MKTLFDITIKMHAFPRGACQLMNSCYSHLRTISMNNLPEIVPQMDMGNTDPGDLQCIGGGRP